MIQWLDCHYDTINVIMFSGPENNFDLELYSPDAPNAAKAESHLAAGLFENITYTANLSGHWRIRIYVVSGDGQYTFNVSVSTPGSEPPPGGGEPE